MNSSNISLFLVDILTNVTNRTARYNSGGRFVYLYIVPMLIILCFASVLVNGYILLLQFWIRRPMSPILKLTMGLAAADFWTSIVLASGFLVNSYLPHALNVRIPNGDCIALSIEAFRLGSIFTSILHLLLISLSHLLVIAIPTKGPSVMNGRVLWILFLFIWTVPPLMFLIGFSSVHQQGFQAIHCPTEFTRSFVFRALIYILLLIPIVVMAVIYVVMIILLHRIDKQMKMQRNKKSKSTDLKWRTLRTTMFMLATFLIGWMPSGTIFLLAADNLIYILQRLGNTEKVIISTSINLLMILKFFINPLIYGLRVPEIRDVLSRPVVCCLPCLPMVSNRPGSINRRRYRSVNSTTIGTTIGDSQNPRISQRTNNVQNGGLVLRKTGLEDKSLISCSQISSMTDDVGVGKSPVHFRNLSKGNVDPQVVLPEITFSDGLKKLSRGSSSSIKKLEEAEALQERTGNNWDKDTNRTSPVILKNVTIELEEAEALQERTGNNWDKDTNRTSPVILKNVTIEFSKNGGQSGENYLLRQLCSDNNINYCEDVIL